MKHGYELIHDFLTKEEHEKYLKTCNRVYNNALQNPNNEHYTWYEDNHLNKIDGAVKFEREFLELASHPILVKRAKEILGIDTNVDIFISKFFPMKPNGGVSTFMHQDNYYFRDNPKKMVSCCVYLQDTYKENGCLRVAKDSHLNGLVEHDTISEVSGIKWIGDDILSNYEIVDLEFPAPYSVFFHIDSIHGCYTNQSDSTRFSLAWEYVDSTYKIKNNQSHVAYDRTPTL
jgi:ectoine hydroxylase-related dioxygenase (phytanoyl-CoA dioxygenase family)